MNYEQFLVALCLWREARGEGADGMAAVYHVMLNRAKAWGKTLTQVVLQRNQFSSMTVRGDAGTVGWPTLPDSTWDVSSDLAKSVSTQDDPTDGALYYANESLPLAAWYTQNIINAPQWHPVTAKIGNHTFRK